MTHGGKDVSHKSESSYILSLMKEKNIVLTGEFFFKVLILGLKELSSLKGSLFFCDRNGS